MTEKRDERMHIRISAQLKLEAKKRALDLGYGKKQGNGLTDYITDLILKDLSSKDDKKLKEFFEYIQDKVEDCYKKETENAIKDYLKSTNK